MEELAKLKYELQHDRVLTCVLSLFPHLEEEEEEEEERRDHIMDVNC